MLFVTQQWTGGVGFHTKQPFGCWIIIGGFDNVQQTTTQTQGHYQNEQKVAVSYYQILNMIVYFTLLWYTKCVHSVSSNINVVCSIVS